MKSALLVLALLAGTAYADGKQITYAIVIGNNAPPRTGEPLQPLRYADDDAVRYYQLFSRLAETKLLAVLDTQTQRRYPLLPMRAQPPTVDNLRRTVEEFAQRMSWDRMRGDRPVLYFAFSGHGARDERGQPFLALLDGALTQKTLYDDILARMPTTITHLIVDACNAGGVVGVRGGFFDKEANTQAVQTSADQVEPILQATPLSRYPHIGVILATTLGQEAHEWSAIESGVFTHELLSGMLGAADVNGDLVVEYTEVQAFVASANRDIKDPRAVPRVIARPPQANQRVPLVALKSLEGVRLVRGDASRFGHFHIELENGQRYLDAHVDASVTLAVPDAAVAFLRTTTSEAKLPISGAIALAQIVLAPSDVASRGAIEAAYQTQLFASGYGRAYYQGFVDSIGAVGVSFRQTTSPTVTPTERRRKRWAVASAGFAAVALAASITTGALAADAHADYGNTQLQREAADAKARYEMFLPTSIATGVLAIASGVLAYKLWPSSRVTIVPAAEQGNVSISLGGQW